MSGKSSWYVNVFLHFLWIYANILCIDFFKIQKFWKKLALGWNKALDLAFLYSIRPVIPTWMCFVPSLAIWAPPALFLVVQWKSHVWASPVRVRNAFAFLFECKSISLAGNHQYCIWPCGEDWSSHKRNWDHCKLPGNPVWCEPLLVLTAFSAIHILSK